MKQILVYQAICFQFFDKNIFANCTTFVQCKNRINTIICHRSDYNIVIMLKPGDTAI